MQGPLDALLLRRSLRLDGQEDFAPCYMRHRKKAGWCAGHPVLPDRLRRVSFSFGYQKR